MKKHEEPTCTLCKSKDQVARHKHILGYGDGLPQHLRDNLPMVLDDKTGKFKVDDVTVAALLAWCHSTHAMYRGMVSEQGDPLAVWEARQQVYRQYDAHYLNRESASFAPGPGRDAYEFVMDRLRKVAKPSDDATGDDEVPF